MKIWSPLLIALGITLGLAGCGANSMFEAESMPADAEVSAKMTADSPLKAAVPEGCVRWFDGCNSCSVKDGEIGACTKMACKGGNDEAKCQAFAPGFSADAAKSDIDTIVDDGIAPETMPEMKRDATAEVPANCKIWFDGCNSCVVLKGKLRGCTSKVCTVQSEAKCTKGG